MMTVDQQALWQAVLSRDVAYDDVFVYAVSSTGIYCRPSCPSRKPKRENVQFFPLPEVAQQAGFRPCARCHPNAAAGDSQVAQVREMCRYVEAHLDESLTLDELSQTFPLSPYHLQRTFKRIVGVSPQQYAEACRMNQVRGALRNGDDISGAAYDAGFGSISRLYSKTPAQFGMTPATYQQHGRGARIRYTVSECRLGHLLIAATERGICAVKIGDSEADVVQALGAEFCEADLQRADRALKAWIELILRHLEGREPHLDLPLDVRATAFQRQVWQALQEIPYGETRSYSAVAEAIGKPRATRAVAQACAANPTALIVPCHRVVRKDGTLGGYRWGTSRKEALLRQERTTVRQLDLGVEA